MATNTVPDPRSTCKQAVVALELDPDVTEHPFLDPHYHDESIAADPTRYAHDPAAFVCRRLRDGRRRILFRLPAPCSLPVELAPGARLIADEAEDVDGTWEIFGMHVAEEEERESWIEQAQEFPAELPRAVIGLPPEPPTPLPPLEEIQRAARKARWCRALRVLELYTVGGVPALARQICNGIYDLGVRQTWFARDVGGKLYMYEYSGAYSPRGEEHVRTALHSICNVEPRCGNLSYVPIATKWSPKLAEELVAYLADGAPLLWDRPPPGLLNLRNGILNLETRTLTYCTPDHLSTVQLPVRYDPRARCPRWDQFVAETFPADAHALAWEIVAWLLAPHVSIQKALLLLGPGGNGKSTFLSALRAFLGEQNVSALSLHTLEENRFATSSLVGKLANFCADLPSEHLESTDVFKACTGGDVISAERKFGHEFSFLPFCRLAFSANYLPRSKDSSEAFYDRWLVVPMLRRFRGETDEVPRHVLDAQLADPEELSGVLNRALEALPGLIQNGFTESATTLEALAEFRRTTDHFGVWLSDNTIKGSDVFVPKTDLIEAYNSVCRNEGVPLMHPSVLGRRLSRLRPDVSSAERQVAGRRTFVYSGIGLRSQDHLSAEERA